MTAKRLLGRVNGFCGCETNKKKAKSKAPPSKTEDGAPQFISPLYVRATRPVFLSRLKVRATCQKQIDRAVPGDLTVHLVLDNYATHKTKEIRAWFLRHPPYHLHFTPTHSSWLNQVERWIALLLQRQIKRGSHYSVRELESAILEFIEVHNEQPKPFVWTKSADAILNSIGRFPSRTLAAHGTNNMQEISDSGD
jgi:transposase